MTASNGRPTSASALTFRHPSTTDETTSPHPSPLDEELATLTGEGTTPPLSDPLAGSPSDSDELPGPSSEDDESDRISSRASSRARAAAERAQQLAARKAVQMAGAMAHQYLARDEAAQTVGLYLVDDEQARAIADPLARIAARHAPADSAVNNPDVADGLAAMMGLADFVRVTIEKQSEATALRVSGRVLVEHDGGGVDEHGGY